MRSLKLIAIPFIFLAGVTILILGSLYLYRNVEKKTLTDADRKQAGGSYIRLSDGITHYQLGGPDTGKTIILLHGFSVPYYIWDSTYTKLTNAGYRVLRYDLFGRGYSDRPDGAYDQRFYFNQLIELIRRLHLKTPITFAGVSFGGRLATDFAGRYPQFVDKVILIDPAYEPMEPDKFEFITRYYESIHPKERIQSQLTDFKYPDRHPDWAKRYQVQMQYKGFVNAIISTMYNYECDGASEFAQLNTKHKPVLLIWGRDDKTVPFNFSDSVRAVLKTDFFPVDDAGHLPHIEQADTVNSRILQFLKKKVN